MIRQIIEDYFGECSPTYQLLDSQTLQIQAELSPGKSIVLVSTIRGTLEESAKQLDNGEDVIY